MLKNSFGNDRYVMQKGRRIKKKKGLDVEQIYYPNYQ